MNTLLEGCLAKLGRAEAHIHDLEDTISLFLAAHPYVAMPETDFQTGGGVVRGYIGAEVPRDPFGLIVGDTVHNLRSALDQLAWGLVIASGSAPPVQLQAIGRRSRSQSSPTAPCFTGMPKRLQAV